MYNNEIIAPKSSYSIASLFKVVTNNVAIVRMPQSTINCHWIGINYNCLTRALIGELSNAVNHCQQWTMTSEMEDH